MLFLLKIMLPEFITMELHSAFPKLDFYKSMPQKVQIFNSLFPKYQCNLNPQCITFSDIVFKCILNTSKNFAQKLQYMIYNYKGYE